MTRVLFLGLRPTSVDFSDPALPPGLDAGKIQAGIDTAMRLMAARGWQAEQCMVTPDDAGLAEIEARLRGQRFDCVVIGGGVRIPPRNLRLFERMVNVVHRHAQDAAIAFNQGPETTADAVARWVR